MQMKDLGANYTNLEKNESGIHMRVCLEVQNLQQQQHRIDVYTTNTYDCLSQVWHV